LAWALGVSVFAPFPTKKEWPVKLHGFLNTGRVVGWESGKPQIFSVKTLADPMSLAQSFASNVARMYSSPNMSVGLGLLYRLDPIRVEVNFALPLVGRKGEGWARGLNVGIGLEFL
jgi:outer membrane protein insertion porin family